MRIVKKVQNPNSKYNLNLKYNPKSKLIRSDSNMKLSKIFVNSDRIRIEFKVGLKLNRFFTNPNYQNPIRIRNYPPSLTEVTLSTVQSTYLIGQKTCMNCKTLNPQLPLQPVSSFAFLFLYFQFIYIFTRQDYQLWGPVSKLLMAILFS